ncbi:MAG: zinc ribbon domain-containing protein [Oscillospiraceae bacterium]
MALLDKINDIAKTASEKTNSVIETTKLNNKINAEERNIAAITAKIGQYYVSKLDAGETLPDDVMSMYEGIKMSRETILATRAEIENLNPPKVAETGSKFCTNCGAKLDAEARFCTSCGSSQQ